MANRNFSLPIQGMHCAGCETILNDAIKDMPGLSAVRADHVNKIVQLCFDDSLTSVSKILAVIESKGYSYGETTRPGKRPFNFKQALVFVLLFLLVGGITYWGKSLMPGIMKQFNPNLGYWVIFTLGIFTGFHCIGMCGGFVVNYTQGVMSQGRKALLFAHMLYALGKNISYALLGGIFGILGALVTVTPMMRGIAAITAGVSK